MSAPNQVQQNAQPGAYYSDQYSTQEVVFVGRLANGTSSPSDTFTATIKYHALGDIVLVDIATSALNAGTSALIADYQSTTALAIPEMYKPIYESAAIALMGSNSTLPGIKYCIDTQFNQSGVIGLYPFDAALFPVGVRLHESTGFYFKSS